MPTHLALALTSLALVGPVEDTRGFVAVEADGARVRAYVCDGTSRRAATISQWFRGSWDRRAPLTLRAGGRTLRLRPPGPDGRIGGRLIQDGTSNTLTVTPATGPAGLYDIRRAACAQPGSCSPTAACAARWSTAPAHVPAGAGHARGRHSAERHPLQDRVTHNEERAALN